MATEGDSVEFSFQRAGFDELVEELENRHGHMLERFLESLKLSPLWEVCSNRKQGAHLTLEQKLIVRWLAKSGKYALKEIATLFKTSVSTVRKCRALQRDDFEERSATLR